MREERQKVLIVDDTPANIQILNEILHDEYNVFFATSGRDGIRVAQRELPDLILLDIMMPDMDGYDVCKQIKSDAKTARIPVIFITAMSDVEDETKGLECGAIDYITKPISPPIVKSRVKNHLELKCSRDVLEALTVDLGNKNRELEKERALAHKVLENILPNGVELPGFRTATLFQPSNQIGGDFFDAWSSGDCTHFLIGDISGHSTSAALMMAVSKGMLYSLGHALSDPVEIVRSANRMLCQMMIGSEMFLTLVYALCDRQTNNLCVVSAGHNPVYLVRGNAVTAIEATGPVIGWDTEDSWTAANYKFAPGSLLFLHTDGLVEARNAEGREIGDGFRPILAGGGTSRELLATIFDKASRFCGGHFEDDVTIFAIERV